VWEKACRLKTPQCDEKVPSWRNWLKEEKPPEGQKAFFTVKQVYE